MKKIILTMLAAAMFSIPAAASASDEVDVAEVSCREVLESEEDLSYLFIWIDGYMSAASGNTRISDSWMEKLGTHIGEFCSENPDKTIMDAMKAMPAD